MKKMVTLVISNLILVLMTGNLLASVSVIQVADADSVRAAYGSPIGLLNILMIKKGSITEDQALLEYDISGLSLAEGETVELDIVDMSNGDGGGETGVIQVYSYYGDGEVTVDDFDAGTFYTSFDAPGIYTVTYGDGWISHEYLVNESINVTSVILDAIANDRQYVGFRLSTITSDSYTLSYVPTLNIVPEPGTVVLMLGGILLAKRKLA